MGIPNLANLSLAIFQTNRGYGFLEAVVFALGAGAGFALALVIMASLREEVDLSDIPEVLKGAAITLIIGGILSLSFMGFAGMGN